MSHLERTPPRSHIRPPPSRPTFYDEVIALNLADDNPLLVYPGRRSREFTRAIQSVTGMTSHAAHRLETILIEYARTYSQWIIHEKEDADLGVPQALPVDRIFGVKAYSILEVEAFDEHSNVLHCDSRKLEAAARNDKKRGRSNMNLEDVNHEDSNVEAIALEDVMLSNENTVHGNIGIALDTAYLEVKEVEDLGCRLVSLEDGVEEERVHVFKKVDVETEDLHHKVHADTDDLIKLGIKKIRSDIDVGAEIENVHIEGTLEPQVFTILNKKKVAVNVLDSHKVPCCRCSTITNTSHFVGTVWTCKNCHKLPTWTWGTGHIEISDPVYLNWLKGKITHRDSCNVTANPKTERKAEEFIERLLANLQASG
ncbi:hypothetical protein HDU99_003423, partial [Rhizoclosmatium hyalinum]